MMIMGIRFKYILKNGEIKYIPFRPGDLVKITDWGGRYEYYESAFMHFTGSKKKPYYSEANAKLPELRKRLFKVVDIAEHGIFEQVVCYLIDNEGRGAVMSSYALEPFKVCPLRENERKTIQLDKIE